jgi:ribosomal protein L21E
MGQNSRKESETVRQFVQSFYDWYTPLAFGWHPFGSHQAGSASDKALQTRPFYLTRHLLRVLKEDSAAQAKVKGYIVGLDFDPFMNSQDPDQYYKVGTVKQKGRSFWVDVHAVTDGKADKGVIVVAEVVKLHGKYRFANFYYPSGSEDLLSILKLLKRDREPARKHRRSINQESMAPRVSLISENPTGRQTSEHCLLRGAPVINHYKAPVSWRCEVTITCNSESAGPYAATHLDRMRIQFDNGHRVSIATPNEFWAETCRDLRDRSQILFWDVHGHHILVWFCSRDESGLEFRQPLLYEISKGRVRMISQPISETYFALEGGCGLRNRQLLIWSAKAYDRIPYMGRHRFTLRTFDFLHRRLRCVSLRTTRNAYLPIDEDDNLVKREDPLSEFGLRWFWWSARTFDGQIHKGML